MQESILTFLTVRAMPPSNPQGEEAVNLTREFDVTHVTYVA